MTTNAYDISTGVLASDSRWSKDVGNYLFFVDDVGYEKIVFDTRIALLFAGNLGLINSWKIWFNAGRYGTPPAVDPNFSVCIVDMTSGIVRQDRGTKLVSSDGGARFAGTGSPHALQCWTTNRDAVRSVQTAILFDFKTGGKVSYLRRKDRANNLTHNATMEEVVNELRQTGMMIMLTSNQNQIPISIKDAIANDPAANEAYNKAVDGSGASLCAPFIGMGTPWTSAEEAELHQILSEYPPES